MRKVISRARSLLSRLVGFARPPITLGNDLRPVRAEDAWQRLVSESCRRLERERFEWDSMDPAVMAASTRPALRQLFPVWSMFRSLSFSRCTNYPHSADLPRIRRKASDDFVYDVCAALPDGRVLGSGDADYVADLVVQHLPPDCGPALVGSVQDLAAQIAEKEGVPVAEVLNRLCPRARRQ